MRKLDLDQVAQTIVRIERDSRSNPSVAQERCDLILESATLQEHWVTRMHVLRLIPRLQLTADQEMTALKFTRGQLEDPNRFVQAWALDTLAHLAERDPTLRAEILERLSLAFESGSAAMRTRARHLLARLNRAMEPKTST